MGAVDEERDGLEGVLAFASEIAEPDRDGGALRYRGVDIEELGGTLPFERGWGLLVAVRPARPCAVGPGAPPPARSPMPIPPPPTRSATGPATPGSTCSRRSPRSPP